MGENTVDKLLWKAWINAGSKFLLYFKGNVFRSARHKKKILFCKQFRLMELVRPEEQRTTEKRSCSEEWKVECISEVHIVFSTLTGAFLRSLYSKLQQSHRYQYSAHNMHREWKRS